MAKKLKTLADDEHLASAVRTSAQQIWQAGLGAFAKAQEEGGRVFSKLVKEGTELQRRAEDQVSDVAAGASKIADGVGKQASGSWDKLEQVFEDRVARAMGKMGVPTQQDIHELNQRIEQLSKLVADLSGSKAPVKPATKASAKPATKSAAKTGVVPRVKAAAVPAAKPAAKTAAKKPASKKAAASTVPLAKASTAIPST